MDCVLVVFKWQYKDHCLFLELDCQELEGKN